MFDPIRLQHHLDRGTRAALCTVVHTSGSTPRKAGAGMLVIDDGSDEGNIEGTVGGGAIEHDVRRAAIDVIRTCAPRLVEVALTTDLGMCCGGSMKVFIDPLQEKPPAYIFGAGHVGAAVCELAANAGFVVTVLDPRDDLRTAERLPKATSLVDDYERDDIEALQLPESAFCLVVTHDHPVDQRLVEDLLKTPARVVGMIGSQRKAKLCRERCLAKGYTDDDLARLHSPVGLDILAETAEEIAVSIVAQWIQQHRQHAQARAQTAST